MNVLAQLSSIPVRRTVALVAPVAIFAGACADFPSSPGPLDGNSASVAQASVTPGTFSAGSKAKKTAGGRLAFAGPNGIYTMDPDGSGLALLTQGSDPSWSPDGQRIAFWRFQNGWASGIYVMNADGSNITRVTLDGYQPTWSPDGKQLAFGCGGICVVNVDGSGRRSVTPPGFVNAYQDCVKDSDPSWSRNGVIAFTRWPDYGVPNARCLSLLTALMFPFDFWTEIWLVEPDGTNLRSIKNAEGDALTYAGWPAWSPDGSQLAFYTGGIGYDAIAIVDGYGFEVREVKRRSPVNWEEFLGGPDWSPDGKRIVFGSAANWGFATLSGELIQPAQRQLPSRFAVWSWSRL